MDRILAAQPEQCTYPDCPYPCMDLPDCIEQEPVIDKSAAIRIATVLGWTPQREWVGLDHHNKKKFSSWLDHKSDDEVFTAIEALLKEMNT